MLEAVTVYLNEVSPCRVNLTSWSVTVTWVTVHLFKASRLLETYVNPEGSVSVTPPA